MIDGLDLWVADQLRKKGKGTPEEALGNAQQHYAQLRTGLEQIADKHATRLPALFHPDSKMIEKEKAAGHPVTDTVPMNVYFWKDAKDGKYHLHDLTTPSRPHEQTVDGPPSAALLNTFFEEVARYPEGEVRYTIPGGAAGAAPTTGKTKWYEWVGYAGLALAAVGLALLSGGASIPATLCFAAGAVAGGISAGGHLADSAHLGTATTATVVLDVAQIASSFLSFGALSITVKAGGATAALASSRWFVPLVSTAAGADVVQLVALTDITFTELDKIAKGAGSVEDKQRAAAVVLTQLIVVGGLTALSVRGARNTRALAGQNLEVVEQNGGAVLRGADESSSAVADRSKTPHGGADNNPTSDAHQSTEPVATTPVTNRASVVEPPWKDGDPLPRSSAALIDRAKFEKYSMDPNNKGNGGKAVAFKTLGYEVDSEAGRQFRATDVVEQLKNQLAITPAKKGKSTAFGDRFEVRVQIKGPSGEGTLVTVWQVEGGVPRLITNWLEVHI